MDTSSIKFATWNVENFIEIDKIIRDTTLRDKFIEKDIIFLQEWKNEEKEGEKFMNYLESNQQNLDSIENIKKFGYCFSDRCCILFNTSIFKKVSNTPIELTLPLDFELSIFERQYTSKKTHFSLNLVLEFKTPRKIWMNHQREPVIVSHLNLVSFHLGSFNPSDHQDDLVHQHQMNDILKYVKSKNEELHLFLSKTPTKTSFMGGENHVDPISSMRNEVNVLIILAGDTNYRFVDRIEPNLSKHEALLNKKETDLFTSLIDQNEKVDENIKKELNLRDVDTAEVKKPTQSFTLLHENGYAKDIAKSFAIKVKKCKNNSDNCSGVSLSLISIQKILEIDDARLDFMVTNAKTNTPLNIIVTDYSDHYILESSIEGFIEKRGKNKMKITSRKNKRNKKNTIKKTGII